MCYAVQLSMCLLRFGFPCAATSIRYQIIPILSSIIFIFFAALFWVGNSSDYLPFDLRSGKQTSIFVWNTFAVTVSHSAMNVLHWFMIPVRKVIHHSCLHESGEMTLMHAPIWAISGAGVPRFANIGKDCGSAKHGTIRRYHFALKSFISFRNKCTPKFAPCQHKW